jgi:catecholate siderophore receptor
MKKITRKHGVALLAIALANFNLSAQDGGATSELNPLNVVGSKGGAATLSPGLKTSLPASKIPQSLSIMSKEQIKAQGIKSIGDIIDYTPGVINSQGEGHRDAAVIRGFRTTQDFYRDGIRDDVQYYRPLYNVEQVEVLRGPNALVSGFGGAYGIINRVSKKGVIGEDFTTLSGSVDTFGETNVQLDKNMQLNDNTALRVNIFGENLSNHRDFYYGDAFGVNPTIMYDLGNDSTLSISYEYLNQERFIDRGIPTGDNNRPVEALKDYVFGDPSQNFSTHEAHILRAVLDHKLSDAWSGSFSASHSSHNKLYQNMYPSDYNQTANTIKLNGYLDTTQRDTGILSYNIQGELETGSVVHNIIAGIEYINTDNDNDRFYADFDTQRPAGETKLKAAKSYAYETFNVSRKVINNNVGYLEGNVSKPSVNNYTGGGYDDTHGELSVFSLYIQDEINLSSILDVVLGARFDSMDYDVNDVFSDPDKKYSDSDDTFSPKVGLILSPTNELSLFASYSETYQQLSGDQYASIKTGHEKVDPNTFENTEFGFIYNLPVGLSLSGSYFQIDSSKAEETPKDSGIYKFFDAETNGFELMLQGSLTDKWFINAGYTDLDATDKSGNRIQEAPEEVFSIWNNYLVSDRLAVNLGIIHQAESIMKNGKSAYLPEYTRVDVGASYLVSDNTTIGLNIENLTDELYFPHSHSNHQASVGAPINAMLSITSSF